MTSATRPPLAHGSHTSFFGDGNEVWQETSRTQAAHAPLLAVSSGTGAKQQKFPPISEAPIMPRRPRGPIYGGFGGNRGSGDLFFGFGWGLDGLGGCDPPWAFGCGAFAYPNSGYQWDASAGEYAVDDSTGEQSSDEPSAGIWQDPPAAPANTADEIAAEKSLVVLYLNDGSVYALTNYWVAGGKLHYGTSYGADNSLDLSELDLQRTVNANAARGVEFTLRPAPAPTKAAPEPSPAPQIPPQQ